MTSRTSLLTTTRTAIAHVDKTDTPLGQLAMLLAARLSRPGVADGAVAGLSRELREVITQATQGAAAVDDPVDELRVKRDSIKSRAG